MGKRRVSLATIAAEAGVSKAMVSLVLNDPGTGRFRPETRQKIMRAAHELGYDMTALRTPAQKRMAALDGKRVLFFGALYGTGCGFYQQAIEGVQSIAKEYGIRLEIGSYDRDAEKEDLIRKYIAARDIDAYVLAGYAGTVAPILEEHHQPFVIMGDINTIRRACPIVKSNNFVAGQMAALHTYQRGHRHVAFVGCARAGDYYFERLGGVESMCFANGMSLEHASGRDVDTQEKMNAFVDALLNTKADRPTAVICSASAICKFIVTSLAERSIRIPDNLSVLTFDHLRIHPELESWMTGIEIDQLRMGRIAMAKLSGLLSGLPDVATSELVYPMLVDRGSVKTLEART